MEAAKETKGTKLVIGGIYRKQNDRGEIEFATCFALIDRPAGDARQKRGTLQRADHAAERVVEGTEALDAWALIYDPVALLQKAEPAPTRIETSAERAVRVAQEAQAEMAATKAAKGKPGPKPKAPVESAATVE